MHKKQREHGRIFHRTYTELEIMDTKVGKKKQVRELRSAGKIKLECKKNRIQQKFVLYPVKKVPTPQSDILWIHSLPDRCS